MPKEKSKKIKTPSEIASALGRLGGSATVQKYGTSHMSELGKKSAKVRSKNKPTTKK
jgi:hypothetical protein